MGVESNVIPAGLDAWTLSAYIYDMLFSIYPDLVDVEVAGDESFAFFVSYVDIPHTPPNLITEGPNSSSHFVKNETCSIKLEDTAPDYSSYILTFREISTGKIRKDASFSEIKSVLEAHPLIGVGNIDVRASTLGTAGEEIDIEFVGALAATRLMRPGIDWYTVLTQRNTMQDPTTIVYSVNEEYRTGSSSPPVNQISEYTINDQCDPLINPNVWPDLKYHLNISIVGSSVHTADIAWNSTPAEITAAIEAVFEPGVVIVTSPSANVYHCEFTGSLGNQHVFASVGDEERSDIIGACSRITSYQHGIEATQRSFAFERLTSPGGIYESSEPIPDAPTGLRYEVK